MKGAFKNSPFISQLLMLIGVSLLGAFIFSLLFYFFIMLKGDFSVEMLENPAILYQNPDSLRVLQFFQSLGMFFFPALLLASLFSDDRKAYLQIKEYSSVKLVFYVILSVFAIQPFINLMAEINAGIRLPESMKSVEDWMMQMEEEGKQLSEMMLRGKDLLTLAFNIVIIGVIAGVGEEFFFRGVMQNVFRKVFRNEHVVIWTVALIFSAIHFQFYGFIPRMLLGAYFGYLLYYTKNIWAPVLAHFTHNTMGVLVYYSLHDTDKLEEFDSIGTGSDWWLGLVSLFLGLVLFLQIVKTAKRSSTEQ